MAPTTAATQRRSTKGAAKNTNQVLGKRKGTAAAEKTSEPEAKQRKSNAHNTTSSTPIVPVTPGMRVGKSEKTVLPHGKGRKPADGDKAEPKPKRPKSEARASISSATSQTIPVTPGMRVGIATPEKKTAGKRPEPDGGAKLANASGKQQKQKQPSKTKAQAQTQATTPSTLPTGPNEATLVELRTRYDVRLLSVISSSRMEKRIAASLDHLRDNANGSKKPGLVLFQARAGDANKMISIVEIAKRRMREGSIGEERTWCQYNRIYNVNNNDDGDKDDDEDDFESMPNRFLEAIGDRSARSKTVVTTYMSIFLSRDPVPELQRIKDITTQTSNDTMEQAYEKWIKGK